MSQQRWLTLSIFTLVCGCLLYIGCTTEKPVSKTDGTAETDGGKPGQTAPRGPKKLLDGWKKPTLALIISGEVHGYLEPCGCSDTQSGGLARRADLFRQLRKERGWDVVGLDLGGLLNRERASRKQSQLKFQALKAAMEELGYVSVGLGPEELAVDLGGSLFLYSQWADSAAEDSPVVTNKFNLISANVQPYAADMIAFPQTHQIIEASGKKLAVTSILGEKIFREMFGNNNSLGYVAPAEALPPVIEKMQAEKPDLLVLLSNARFEESKLLAEKFPQFQLVVSIGTENPHHREEYVGKTRVITLGHKGKHVAVAGFYPDQEPPIKVEIVDLDKDRFAADERMRKHMQHYQTGLRQEYADLIQPIPHPSGTTDTYVGAAKCGSCHKQAYAKWKTTRHAHAYESLEKGRKGQEDTWVSRVHDPECLACHVTGWNPQEALPIHGGFTSASETPHLMGQQCENCHGPGSEHTRLEELWEKDRQAVEMGKLLEARLSVKQDRTTVEKNVCMKCHDYENSPTFNFETYWPKVEHKGRN